jgi:hypothetical protein
MVKFFTSKLKQQLLLFFIVLIISLIAFTIYKLIKPEKEIMFNYNPLPEVSPKDLPDAPGSMKSCFNTLTPCTDVGAGCPSCGGDFECKKIDTANFYNLNGIEVPTGTWCLPKHEGQQTCNVHTGKWVWSSGNCPNGKSQCWKCVCLYPDLYGDPETGCTTQKACLNEQLSSESQKDNKLVATVFAPDKYKGQVWDPTSTSSDSDILRLNPYQADDKGNPYFSCRCNGEGQLLLPNDFYNCNMDSCFIDLNIKSLNCSSDGICKCDCSSNGGIKIREGQYNGMCIRDNFGYCTDGNFDEVNYKCNCPSGLSRDCNSLYVRRDGKPDCVNPENMIGKECVNVCIPSPCKNQSQCAIDQAGYDSGTNKDGYICQCETATTTEQIKDAGNDSYIYKFRGKNCEEKCLPTDFTVHKYLDWGKLGTSNDNYAGSIQECCSRDTVHNGIPTTFNHERCK